MLNLCLGFFPAFPESPINRGLVILEAKKWVGVALVNFARKLLIFNMHKVINKAC